MAWTLINPVMVVLAYWMVFKFLFGSPIPNFALFLFVGLTVWLLTFGGMQMATPSIVNNASLITKVRFPREIVPLVAVIANCVLVVAMLAIAIPLCIVLQDGSLVPLLLLPAILLLATAMTIGVGLALSALNVYFRDVEHVIAAIGTPLFFLTPIFYTFSSLPESAANHQWLINLLHYGNPISPFVITTQDVLFFGVWPAWSDLLYCLVAAVAFLLLGRWIFRRFEREMAVEL